jgi:hypothetical protein
MNKNVQFEDLLDKAEKNQLIQRLYRGVDKDTAFKEMGLNVEYNSISQYKDRIFYYGEKAAYFWKRGISSEEDFSVNDISNNVFESIFRKFNFLINKKGKEAETVVYFKKNKHAIQLFENKSNKDMFISIIESLNDKDKFNIRNHYLSILHKLNETYYNQVSHFVSCTINKEKAVEFSNAGIVINLWSINIDKYKNNTNLPIFIGDPYENEKEQSVFAAVFPHYIISFTYNGKKYYNPAIKKTENLKKVILSGLDIDQWDFLKRRDKDDFLRYSVETDGENYRER